MVEDHQVWTVEEGQKSECIPTNVDANLPNVIGVDQLLEVLAGDKLQFLNQMQCPSDFGSLPAACLVAMESRNCSTGQCPDAVR